MMTKNILGLDLGTNSIGWALIKLYAEERKGSILGMGTRILPMSQDVLGDFGKGNSVSQTAARTGYRGVRRLRERFLLRRERLHRVLNILGFLPDYYAAQIDFDKRFGKFKAETEPKLPYNNEGFIFKNSFEEMLSDFKISQPELLSENKKVPYDWTIYYLRKKAVSQRIEKEELAWILLNFNQKRGYYQLRGEDFDEEKDKTFVTLNVDKVIDSGEKVKGNVLFDVYFTNGWKYEKQITKPEDWVGRSKEFIITESPLKNGDVKRTFKAVDSEKDWIAIKAKTEQEIETAHKTVGSYIYDAILQNPKQKIKGKLVRTIERKFYKEELKQILEKQKDFHPELQNEDLYSDCVRELYRNNDAHQLSLTKKNFIHLFVEDIIFYQRPLRSQKSSVSNCTLEFRKYKDKSGTEGIQFLKVIPKSNPYYQEFRIWQWISNLKIYRRDDDVNVTLEYLKSTEDYEDLFVFLNTRKEVDQKACLKHFKLSEKTHRWNYVEDKKYPCNETGTMILERLKKVWDSVDNIFTREKEQQIWHIIYSVNDKTEYEKALKSFTKKNDLDDNSFFEAFRKFPPFDSEYGSFSEKAIKKLLPLIRTGKYWNWEAVDEKTKNRIQKMITGECDEDITDNIREKTLSLQKESDFQGLPLWLAQYVVYGRHSEASVAGKWNSVNDMEEYLKEFKQHSLRNPIVEQVITETIRVVKDIWIKYGNGAADFFNEIHIELGREMKLPAKERSKMTQKISENENTNLRIKALLAEMMNDSEVQNVRSYSPMHQEILKIYEDGALNSEISVDDDILKISKTAQPSPSDLKKYKLWLEQKYRSPYTGDIIPLNKLFTTEYEIEHIIPQSRYFDNSFSNKVICESSVNRLKDNYIGLGFIKHFHGYKISDKTKVFEVDEYEDFVKKNYASNWSKRSKLLLEEIPEDMIERQLNDTRYISKYISGILSNIVRKKENDDGVNSKDIIPGNGKITLQLKQDWGLNDVWNDLVLPRFERMNELTKSNDFTVWNEKYQKFLPTVPVEFSKGFSKKRIDHRNHALDALVIACATRDHVNLLNNQSARSEMKRYDLKRKLMKFEKKAYQHSQTGERIVKDVPVEFLKPWDNFIVEAKENLDRIIVSFKQNLRVINKATNHYEKWIEKDNVKVKALVEQQGLNWAIRKPLHKDTVSGKVDLPGTKVPKGKILTATRKSIDTSFDMKTINSITDTGIQKILKNYLEYKGSYEEAFSPEGIEDMNKNIEKFNDGKQHQPITKVRIFELGSKFPLGQNGNKKHKYVETAKGTNLFFTIYEDDKGKRTYETIPLNEVIERQKQGLAPVTLKSKNDFYLSPNDLVYVATEGESVDNLDFQSDSQEYINNVYKVVSFSGSQIFFVKQNVAVSIVNKAEFSTLNKMERAIDGRMIKECCVKLKIDRIGNMTKS
ncbi:type II CRISPR RNA-guided endonuclease Cas9 [Chryseobacterium sp. OV279]|uniref:type II CRISPR RNA-guided endonuclease Cas9 n=1 Tax=Chryseobacterium sp. OV279 TaxID=1500285 RepID=UPI00091848AE|nr:type II CRISPR RNA-guided endonuclease Cas9 [Chryseobacterium sp. OV279]SHF13086.1 CRISPR-associated endonuclease Csn1 [Chryseobacterium sp. OV279]